MSTTTAAAEPTPVAEQAVLDDRPIPCSGWRVIAAKELGDHIVSVRFMVLLIILLALRARLLTLAQLFEARDRASGTLTFAAYEALGGWGARSGGTPTR